MNCSDGFFININFSIKLAWKLMQSQKPFNEKSSCLQFFFNQYQSNMKHCALIQRKQEILYYFQSNTDSEKYTQGIFLTYPFDYY